MQAKVLRLLERLKVVEEILGKSDVFSDQKAYRELTQEHSYLLKIKEKKDYIDKISLQIAESENLPCSSEITVFKTVESFLRAMVKYSPGFCVRLSMIVPLSWKVFSWAFKLVDLKMHSIEIDKSKKYLLIILIWFF